MHGRGLGDDSPMYVFSAGDEIKRWVVEANTCFITKPVVARDGYPDIVAGDSVVVTATGATRLGTIASEFIEIG
jgi:hypothetical protein